MNFWDVAILLAVAGLVALAIRSFRNGKARGCGDCCNCQKKCDHGR